MSIEVYMVSMLQLNATNVPDYLVTRNWVILGMH
jgi:hypothetical protein